MTAPESKCQGVGLRIYDINNHSHNPRPLHFYVFPLISLNSTRKRRRKQSDPERLYRVFTSFHPWSVCDRCGRPGEQVRMGLCYVYSRYLHVRYKRTNQTVASCGSGAVLRVFGRLNTEGAMMEVRKCQEVCPSQTPPSSKIVSLMAFLGYG